jgi:hypothetical protein
MSVQNHRCEQPKLKSSRQHTADAARRICPKPGNTLSTTDNPVSTPPHSCAPLREWWGRLAPSSKSSQPRHHLSVASYLGWQCYLQYSNAIVPVCHMLSRSLSLSLSQILHFFLKLDDLPCVIQQISLSRLSSGVRITLLVYYGFACAIVGRIKAGDMWLA